MESQKVINKTTLIQAIDNNKQEATVIIQDEDKFEKLIQEVESTLKHFPVIGKHLSDISCMVSLVRKYINKEYTDVPIKTIISIVASLIYIVSPLDFIPDAIPVAGHLDDAALVVFVMKAVHDDVEQYKRWRVENNMVVVEEL